MNVNIVETDKLKNKNKIKLLALGGLGADVINKFNYDNTPGIDSLVLDTDIHTLKNVVLSDTLSVGLEYSGGLGLRGNTELAARIIDDSMSSIINFVSDAGYVVVIVGLGGGFGTGAIQNVMNTLQNLDIFTTLIYTLPFSFEGSFKNDISKETVSSFKNDDIDVLIEIDSNLFVDHSYGRIDLKSAMKSVDNLILELIYNVCYIFNDNANVDIQKLNEALLKFPDIKFNLKSRYHVKKKIKTNSSLKIVKNLEDITYVNYDEIDLNDRSIPAVLRYRKWINMNKSDEK